MDDKEQELKSITEEVKILREQQNVDNIPKTIIVDDKMGLIKKNSLPTLSIPDKRGYTALVSQYGEVIRRRFEKTTVKLLLGST